MLNRDQILHHRGNLRRTVVAVPEWGGDVIIQEFTAAQRDTIEMASVVNVGGRNMQRIPEHSRARLVALAVINEDGSPVFTLDDLPALSELPAAGLERVVKAIQEQNRLDADPMEQARKNLESSPLSEPGSESPSPSEAAPPKNSKRG